jgi:ribosomal protein L28
MKNEEERHKFEAKRTSDEEVTSKIVKYGTKVNTCGQQTGRRFQSNLMTVIYSF